MSAKVGLRGRHLVGAILFATCFAGHATASPHVPAALDQLRWRVSRSFDDLAASPRAARAILSPTSVACGHPVSGTIRQDRWGVGRFAFFLVDPRLHEQLKAFEGKNFA